MDALDYTPLGSPDAGLVGFDAALDAAIEHINRRQVKLGRHRYGIGDQLAEIGRMARRADYAAEVTR